MVGRKNRIARVVILLFFGLMSTWFAVYYYNELFWKGWTETGVAYFFLFLLLSCISLAVGIGHALLFIKESKS